MDNRGNFNLGDEIRNIVQDAVSNRDFNRLNRDIGNIVNGALDEVRRSLDHNRDKHQNWNNNNWNNNSWNSSSRNNNGNNTWNNTRNNNTGNNTGTNSGNTNTGDYTNNNTWNNQSWKAKNDQNNNAWRTSQTWKAQDARQKYTYNNPNNYSNVNRHGYAQNKPVPRTAKFAVPVGQVSGVLFTVFGAIGSTLFGVAIIVLGILGNLLGSSGVFHTIALGLIPCFIASFILSLNGRRIRKRLKRFQRYISKMNGRNYSLIKDLSYASGLSNKSTVKDLQKMIAIGMFPEGHIDDKKTCFMLNSESYEQYLKLQENMRMKEMELKAKDTEKSMSQDTTQEDNNSKTDTLDPKVRKAVEEGRQYVQKIKNANIEIPGEEISRKLDRLEEVTGKIYDYVELHPEKLPEIKKFTEYFLPTTLKLLDAYREFEYQPVEGENISSAKKEIEKTMDTINLAFENMLDGLFEEAAMDISTDISVLETMFAQEGLTEKNIRSTNKMMGEVNHE